MEAAVINSVGSQDTLGYVDAGKFGDRWGAIAEAHKLKKIPLKKNWGESPEVEEVKTFLSENPAITHFAIQYCETSTTVLHDVPAISRMIRDEFPEVLFIVDAISAATTLPIYLDELHIDALVLASQKAFMLPPGLSMVFLSDRYWKKAEELSPTSHYFNLKKERNSQAKGNAAWTPAMSIVFGLNEVLQIFETERWPEVFARHQACSDFCYERMNELGLTPINRNRRSPSVSGGFTKDGLDADEVRSSLYSSHNIRIAGGQDNWKGKVLRVGHMGVITPSDLERCLSALQTAITGVHSK